MPKVSDEYLEARRQQILAAAARCFGRKGIRGTSMRDIYRESGLSAGAVYHYYASKREIVELHGQPGGLCTAWRRGEYTFDGCFHYLVGSGPTNAFHRLWNELVDTDDIAWAHHDEMFRIRLRHARAPDGNDMFHV